MIGHSWLDIESSIEEGEADRTWSRPPLGYKKKSAVDLLNGSSRGVRGSDIGVLSGTVCARFRKGEGLDASGVVHAHEAACGAIPYGDDITLVGTGHDIAPLVFCFGGDKGDMVNAGGDSVGDVGSTAKGPTI